MCEEASSVVHDVAIATAVGRRALPIRLCAAFAHSLGAQHAALSLLPRLEQWQLMHATDESALQAEAAQFAHADGPSVRAALEMRPVYVPDTREDPGEEVSRGLFEGLPGLRQVLALPLHSDRAPIGVICLYYNHRTPLVDDDIAEADRAAALAQEEVLRWRPVHASPVRGRPVWATDTRAARWERIHRAAGCLAARQQCVDADGLAWLQETSRREGRSLLDVADRVLQPSAVAATGTRRVQGRSPGTSAGTRRGGALPAARDGASVR